MADSKSDDAGSIPAEDTTTLTIQDLIEAMEQGLIAGFKYEINEDRSGVDVWITPVKPVEHITLNTIITRSNVSFDEIIASYDHEGNN